MRTLLGSICALVIFGCGSEERDVCDDPGIACVWAGTGERGYNNKNPRAHRRDSKLYFPNDVTFGADGRAYIMDFNNHRVRRVEPDQSLVDLMGSDYEGDGAPDQADRLPACNPAGALGTTIAMNHVTDAEFGPDGQLYVAVWHNNKIRVLDPETGTGSVITGNGNGFRGDDGPACQALLDQPKALAIADDGTIYTIDQRNIRIRKITPAPDRTITTLAGRGTLGAFGDGGPARMAEFGFEPTTSPRPSGALVLDGRSLLVADSMNNRIRRIDLDTEIIDCVAGRLEPGYTGDGGQALDAQFSFPTDIELGPDGKLYVADRNNHVIRAIDLTTGIVSTAAGSGVQCQTSQSECADGVPARDLALNEPYGVAFDAAGNMYISDTHNNRIVRVAR